MPQGWHWRQDCCSCTVWWIRHFSALCVCVRACVRACMCVWCVCGSFLQAYHIGPQCHLRVWSSEATQAKPFYLSTKVPMQTIITMTGWARQHEIPFLLLFGLYNVTLYSGPARLLKQNFSIARTLLCTVVLILKGQVARSIWMDFRLEYGVVRPYVQLSSLYCRCDRKWLTSVVDMTWLGHLWGFLSLQG